MSGAFWIALTPVLWSSPAFPGQVRCAENMSCITECASHVFHGGRRLQRCRLPLRQRPSPYWDAERNLTDRPNKTTIEICEGYLAGNTGTVRDRATALYVLGHAYSRSRTGLAYQDQVNERKAFKLWSRAAKLDPTYIEPHLSIGNMFGRSGEIDQAQAAFDRAEKIDPKDWRVYTGRANAYFQFASKITSTTALAAAEKAAAIKPDEPFVRMVYGRMLQINGRYEEAAKQYEAAVGGYDPSKDTSLELLREPHPLHSLAYVYNKMGKPALAAETLSKYIDSIPAPES